MVKEIRSYVAVIGEEVRKVVVEWLLQVSHSINPILRRETIFMGVHIFDLVVPKLKDVSLKNIQLIALTSLFIAAKYEEIHPEPLQTAL